MRLFFVLHSPMNFCYLISRIVKKRKGQRDPQTSIGIYGIYGKAVLSLMYVKLLYMFKCYVMTENTMDLEDQYVPKINKFQKVL